MPAIRQILATCRWPPCALGLLIPVDGAAPPAEAQVAPSVGRVLSEGSELVIALSDGRVLRSQDLVGTVLDLRSGLRLRIDLVEHGAQREASLRFYSLSVQQSDGTWSSLCLPGPDKRQAVVPIPGRLTESGWMPPSAPAEFELSCTAGAMAKCLRYGYRPWDEGEAGRPMRALYDACIRMVRADYGGHGQAWTRDGTLIDVYDAWQIQSPDGVEGQELEAGWSPDGAVCVRHPRVPDHVSIEELERRYPRLRGRTGATCTEELARANGALLFNRSQPPSSSRDSRPALPVDDALTR